MCGGGRDRGRYPEVTGNTSGFNVIKHVRPVLVLWKTRHCSCFCVEGQIFLENFLNNISRLQKLLKCRLHCFPNKNSSKIVKKVGVGVFQ